jgi:hypothetical protein
LATERANVHKSRTTQSPEGKEMQQESARHLLESSRVRCPDPSKGTWQEPPGVGGAETLSNLPVDLSHELRTSLAIITLLCGNLDRLYERLGDDERRTMIQKMRKHTQRLNELVGDALIAGQESPSVPV